ncbi:MAG: tetratricopeptide repeat protein [Planctomycetes bacterium]|nr:tetratricopeptide repeat protein [Planctomycetota bacterium]
MNAETAYIFRHVVLRDALYQLMLPGVRARLHELVVDVAEAQPHLRMPSHEVAAHARAAQEDNEPSDVAKLREREAAWLRRAVEEATRRSDLDSIRTLGERSLELARGTDGELGALLALADASRETGNTARAEHLLAEAQVLASGRAEALLRVKTQLVGLYVRTGRLHEAESYGLDVLREYERGGDREGAVQALGYLAVIHYHLGCSDEAEREYRQARRLAARQGRWSNLARYTANLALLLGETGRVAEAEVMHREGIRLAEMADDHLVLANILGNFALLLTDTGRHDEAYELYRRALDLEQRVGHRPGYAVALGNLGRLQRMRGNDDEAVRLMTQAIELHRECAAERHEGVMLGHLGDLQFDLGEFAVAIRNLDRCVELLQHAQDRVYEGVMRTARARSRLNLGDVAGGVEDIECANLLLAGDAYEGFRAQCLYPVQARLVAIRGGDSDAVIAECERLHAQIERAIPAEASPLEGLLRELRSARRERRKPALYYGRAVADFDGDGLARIATFLREREENAAS